MKRPHLYPIPVLLLVAFALLSVSCGVQTKIREAAERAKRQNDLKQLGLAYATYCDANGKGPSTADELLPYLENDTLLVQKAKSDYTIIWNVNLTDQAQFRQNGMSQTVLGYETKTPLSAGAVLFADGAVNHVTAAEFTGLPQAKPSTGIKK